MQNKPGVGFEAIVWELRADFADPNVDVILVVGEELTQHPVCESLTKISSKSLLMSFGRSPIGSLDPVVLLSRIFIVPRREKVFGRLGVGRSSVAVGDNELLILGAGDDETADALMKTLWGMLNREGSP